MIHLQAQKLVTYKGDYDTFERTRSERVRNQQKAIEANERTRAHMQVYLIMHLMKYSSAYPTLTMEMKDSVLFIYSRHSSTSSATMQRELHLFNQELR